MLSRCFCLICTTNKLLLCLSNCVFGVVLVTPAQKYEVVLVTPAQKYERVSMRVVDRCFTLLILLRSVFDNGSIMKIQVGIVLRVSVRKDVLDNFTLSCSRFTIPRKLLRGGVT